MTIHGYVPRKIPTGWCEHWAGGYCYHPRSKSGECTGFDQCVLREIDVLNKDMEPPTSGTEESS